MLLIKLGATRSSYWCVILKLMLTLIFSRAELSWYGISYQADDIVNVPSRSSVSDKLKKLDLGGLSFAIIAKL